MNKVGEASWLPKSWILTTMDEVCIKIQDGTHFSPKKQLPEGIFRYVTAKNIRPWGLDLSDITYLHEKDHRAIYERCDPKKGDVLLVKDGVNTGDAAINTLDEEFSLLSSVCMLRPTTIGLSSAYLRYFLLSPVCYQLLAGKMTGTAIKRIILRRIKELPIPLAPLPEQHRIVAKIEKHFTRLDAAVSAFKRIQANLKRYRASVLKAACEGRLVPTEAELAKAEGRDYEPADRLLSRILKERRAKWEADQLAKMKAQGKTPKDGKWKSGYLEPYAPEASQLPTLPEGWTWSSPEALSTFESNAICAGPFGTIFKAKDFRPSGIPIIFLRHVSAGRYLTHKPGFMDKDKWEELFQPYSVFGGELLVTKLGEPPGVCAIYPYDIGPAMVTPDVIKMSVNEHASESRFLMHYFNSEDARRFAFGVAFGTTRLRMTLTIFREIPIPMPPLVEQQRIVAEVERHLSIIEELETVVEANLKRAERLQQSILKRAFEGKLVLQNPTDEPASNLLERIRAERGKKLSKEKVQKNKRRAGKPSQPELDWQTPEENVASTKAQTNS